MRTSLLFSLFVILSSCVLSSVTTSCIKDADDDEQPTPQGEEITIDTTAVKIDSAFVATLEFMNGEWMSQYMGYDSRQGHVSAIRRLVFFSPNGFYDSHIQGIANMEDTITRYREFEHEHGTYSFDAEKQTMKYTIEYDSLLNFELDKLEKSQGKTIPGVGLVMEYTERIWFSKEEDGKRDWIRIDENLMSPDNHQAKVIYKMKNQQ